MANAQDTNTVELRLEHTFDASPQRVRGAPISTISMFTVITKGRVRWEW